MEDIIRNWIKEGNIFNGARKDLLSLFAQLGFTKGAEIGVNRGHYSLNMCKIIPNLKLICVDPWATRRMLRASEKNYQRCIEILSPYNVEFMRMTSVEAAKIVPDQSLDFVYIDALHDYDNVLTDITVWTPKVRIGGIVSGHDYADMHPGLVKAVDYIRKEHKIDECYMTMPNKNDENSILSWFWVRK